MLIYLCLFFFNFIILYWFCHISTWICHRYTRVSHPEPSSLLPPLSPYHPSGLSQCTSPKHPVSCIEPGLATHFIYDIQHVSMPFSQIIPPSPSPTESKRLFYTSVSLLLSRISVFLIIKSKFHFAFFRITHYSLTSWIFIRLKFHYWKLSAAFILLITIKSLAPWMSFKSYSIIFWHKRMLPKLMITIYFSLLYIWLDFFAEAKERLILF